MTLADDSLPAWARHHEPAFAALLRALERVTGFILQPLETPSRDVDRLLAAWLTARGRPTHLVAPADPQAWRGLVAELRALPPTPGRIVLLSGPSTIDDDVSHGLAMVNLHRDGIARELACPLLWCGDPAFLHATWDRAPDFWSIAGIVKHLPAQPLAPPVLPIEISADGPEIGLDELARLYAAAREQEDADNTGSLGIRLIGVMLENNQIEMARGVADQVGRLDSFRIPPTEALRFMRYLERLGQPTAALRAGYHKILEQVRAGGARTDEAQALLQLGIVESMSGRLPAARDAIRSSAEIFADLGDAQSEAAALLQLAQADLDVRDLVDAEATLHRAEEALTRAPIVEFRVGLLILRSRLLYAMERFSDALETLADADLVASGRPEFAASVESLRGAILGRLRRVEEARQALTRALDLYEAQGDRTNAVRLHRMLAALAVHEGDSETAAEHYEAAKNDRDAQSVVERELGLALLADKRGDVSSAALHAWDAYNHSIAHDSASAPAFHGTMLQLVRQAICAIPDDDACAAIDRLIAQDSELPASGPASEDRSSIERAITRMRGTVPTNGTASTL